MGSDPNTVLTYASPVLTPRRRPVVMIATSSWRRFMTILALILAVVAALYLALAIAKPEWFS